MSLPSDQGFPEDSSCVSFINIGALTDRFCVSPHETGASQPQGQGLCLCHQNSEGKSVSLPSDLGTLEGQGCASPTNLGLPNDLMSDLLSDQGFLEGRHSVTLIREEPCGQELCFFHWTGDFLSLCLLHQVGEPLKADAVSPHSDWKLPEGVPRPFPHLPPLLVREGKE